MSREWTPAEERAMASDPSEWEPIEVEVDPTAGIVFEVDFDRSECAVLFDAIGHSNPFEFIKAAALNRAREMLAAEKQPPEANSVSAAD